MNTPWTIDSIPDLSGKTALVTGGNKGLGFATCSALLNKGASMYIACRDMASGLAAKALLQQQVPHGNIAVLPLDLTSLESIHKFQKSFAAQCSALDILVNNAGVVNLAHLQHTAEGHEMHFATNHLGHFALTGLLMPQLLAAENARIVTLSSGGAKFGTIDFDDIAWQRRPYHRMKSYGDSKLANLLFTKQLDKRLKQHNITHIQSVAAHPGLSATERQQSIGVGGLLSHWLAAPVEKGVQSQVRAATDTHLTGGEYFGPRFGIFGQPKLSPITTPQVPLATAEKLWQYSERVTGVKYTFE